MSTDCDKIDTAATTSLNSDGDKDKDVLARLGYKQEFKRDFTRIELFGLSFSIVGVVQSIAYVSVCLFSLAKRVFSFLSAVLLYSIPYGGPVGMIWGVSMSCHFVKNLILEQPNTLVVHMLLFPTLRGYGNGRTRFGSTYSWGSLLLDLQILFS